MENYYKKTKQHLDEHEYITVNQALEIGIKRHVLAEFAKQGKLERIKRGIYSDPNEWIDEFEILKKKKRKSYFFVWNSTLFSRCI